MTKVQKKVFTLCAALAGLLLIAAPATASSWPDAGGGPGNPGFQPVNPGNAPFSSVYSKTSSSDTWILTSPVVTGGSPAAQRVAYGTLSGSVHLQSLLTGAPVGPESGVSIDSAPVGDADLFIGAGNGVGNASFTVLDHAGGSRLLVLHNDDNQGGGIADVALAQIDVATGALLSDEAIPGSDGYTVTSAPVLSDPDVNGHRYLLFSAANGNGGWLGKVQIANATGSNPTLGTASGVQVANLNILAGPTIAYLRDGAGNPTEYAVASTAANGNNPTVVSFKVADLSAGPASTNLNAQAQTPSVPLTPAGLNPGSPGSGVATTPAIYVAAGSSGTARVYRLSQVGNSQTLSNDPGTTLTGLPSQALALNQTTSGGSLSAGRIVVSTEANLYVLDATTLAVLATHSPTNLAAGSTGFFRNEPTIGGGNIFISRDNGDSLVLGINDAQPIPSGFSESPGNASAIASYGRPAVARWFALFVSDRGLFAYATDDPVPPTSSVTSPAHGATITGSVGLSAQAGDERGIQSVVFRIGGSPVATVTNASGGDPYAPAGAVYEATFDTTSLSDGTYMLDAVATDTSGKITTTSSRIVRVENDAPETTIDSGPPASSEDTSPTFWFSSSEGASTFECRIDGAGFAPCTSPYSPGDLALGQHVFEVRASDAAAQTDPTPASHSFAILPPPDSEAPETTVDSGPPATGNDTSPVFEFSSSEGGSTFECRLDSAAFAPCASPYAPGEIGLGAHVFEVRATDGSGHTDASPASISFRVQAPPPLEITMGAVNMTPTGRINLPVACPESASDNCQGVVSLWVWTVVPHAHDHRDHAHKPVAGERGPAYRHKRRRSRVGRKEFNVLAGKTQRVPMNVGRNARDRACRQGRLPVTVIVRHRVGDEWKLSSERLVLEPQRCRSN